MRFSFKTCLAAGLLAAMLGPANLAYATVFKEAISGDFTPSANPGDGAACTKLFAAVASQTTHALGPEPVRTQMSFGSVATGDTHAGTDPVAGNIGDQSVSITSTSNNNKKFDWLETTGTPAGFEVVLVQGKEQIAFIHIPSATQGASYGDITSPLGVIDFVLFCSQVASQAFQVNPEETCQISQVMYNAIYQPPPDGSGFNGPSFFKDQSTGAVSVCVPPGNNVSRCCTACTTNGDPSLPSCQLVDASVTGNAECDQATPGDANDLPFCRQASDGSFLTPADTPASVNVDVFQAPAPALGISADELATCQTYTWNSIPFSYPTPCASQ